MIGHLNQNIKHKMLEKLEMRSEKGELFFNKKNQSSNLIFFNLFISRIDFKLSVYYFSDDFKKVK